MCIRDRLYTDLPFLDRFGAAASDGFKGVEMRSPFEVAKEAVSYTHLRAHETVLDLVCRLLLEKKNIH